VLYIYLSLIVNNIEADRAAAAQRGGRVQGRQRERIESFYTVSPRTEQQQSHYEQ